jgi:4-amino-4-deoxy-L-arabinose transferase-like glycosyltransferase
MHYLSVTAEKIKKPATIILILIFILGIYLRVDFVTSVSHKQSHDTINYDKMVRQLLEDGVYAYKETTSNARVTPGYPLFMAAVYLISDYKHHDPFPNIRYLQVLASVVTLFLVYLIARRLGGTVAGLIATLFMAIYPPFIWTNGGILTETLAMFFFILYIYFQLIAFDKESKGYALLAGVTLGLLVLTRPEFLVLIGISYAFQFLRSKNKVRTIKLFIVSAVSLGVILSPWVIRNIITLHEVVVASTQVNPFAAGTYPNKNYEDGLVDRHGKTQMEVAKERLTIGFTQHTWTYIKWYTIGKLDHIYGRMFFGSGHSPMYPVIPYKQPFHLAIVLCAIPALLSLLLRWRQPAMLIGIIVVFMSLTRLVFVPEYRYNFTAMPLLIIVDCVVGIALCRFIAARLKFKSKVTL